MKVTGFDHLVLDVADVERSLAFYRDRLGLAPVRLEEWRAKKVPFPSLRVNESTIIDLISTRRDDERRTNVDHICLVVEPLDWQEVVESGEFEVVDGPGRRSGARGDGESLYVRDPDGNTVELRYYEEDLAS